jgi:hypothetical protein
MVPAICVLHNFIRIHDIDDLPDILQHPQVQEGLANNSGDLGNGDVSAAESNRASILRDSIAQDMWASYQAYRGIEE